MYLIYINLIEPNFLLIGHPSDVIIGGGVDIVVGEATQGRIYINSVIFNEFFLLYQIIIIYIVF